MVQQGIRKYDFGENRETVKEPSVRPIAEFRAGLVRASVWQNEHEKPDGQSFAVRSVTFERSYTDKNGAWKKSQSYNAQNLACLRVVIAKAEEYVLTSTKEDVA